MVKEVFVGPDEFHPLLQLDVQDAGFNQGEWCSLFLRSPLADWAA